MSDNHDPVFKILAAPVWNGRSSTEEVPRAAIDHSDGYMHLSAGHQVRETAKLHFAGQGDLVLLRLDPLKIADLRWEPSRGGALFPHAYGTVSVHAVTEVTVLARAPGQFSFPDDLPL